MKRFLLGCLVLGLLAVGLASLLARDYRETLMTPLPVQGERFFDVPKGATLARVVADLHAQGLLPPPRLRLYLRLYGRLRPDQTALKAGEYRLTEGMTAIDALALFVSGKAVMHELRIVEGLRFDQALALVRAHPALEHTLPADIDGAGVMALLDRPDQHPEGRFFPDTYLFPRGMSDIAFLRRAYAAAEKALQEEWATKADSLPYDDPYQALIMASIVERETGLAEERPEIAGVFVRRLLKGMRLQTDPTVIYGLGASFDGNLRKIDLLTDGAYNTYTRIGLPPTPICLPGRAALHAALHPAEGDTLYFVARGDGSHQFSTTLQDHSAAVRRYQLGGGKP